MTHLIPLLLFGFLIGATTVLFGFGGGFVVVPVIYGLAGDSPDAMHIAVATSTAVMVVNASFATLANRTTGLVRREYLWPLAGFIAVGAAIGALAAVHASERLVHVLFVVYLAATILDSVLRAGFVDVSARSDVPTKPATRAPQTIGYSGVGIGAVAAFLGVGGSVMTVPLLRRKRLSMAAAAATANPLSLPIALAGTVIYAFGRHTAAAGSVGYVDLTAAGALVAASLPTIVITRRLVPRVPDRVHARAYLALLVVSLIATLVV